MSLCLIGLGSNQGDRPAALAAATSAIDHLPLTRVISRSAWHDTEAVGGAAGQPRYLNGAVLACTALPPTDLLADLLAAEARLGRVRGERWGRRTIDLDLLLYNDAIVRDDMLTAPHPRMTSRRFVLQPAAEIAPGMRHSTSQWTVRALLNQLDYGEDVAHLACEDPHFGDQLVNELSAKVRQAGPCDVSLDTWRGGRVRGKLTLAVQPAAGRDEATWRKMLALPTTGPVTWLRREDPRVLVEEAAAALGAVWPELSPMSSGV